MLTNERIEQERILKVLNALENNIYPVYQPIREKNNNSKKFTKYEVLARLDIDKSLLKYDTEFINISKKYNYYYKVTHNIIKKSFKFLDKLKKIHPDKHFEFAINIQMDDIKDQNTIDFLHTNLDKYSLSSNITLELSEEDSLTNENENLTRNFIKKFKEIGTKFSLDDFGTGYSTFHPLIAFEFDYIKLDMILVKDIYKDPKKYYICDVIKEFAQRNDMYVVAEYVENKRHEKALEAIEIDFFQGYRYSKPKNKKKILAKYI